jgi:hypothetical protein
MSEAQEDFRKRFPKLSHEIEQRTSVVRIGAVRSDHKEAEKAVYCVQGYEPTAIDYLRRCENDGQALEIINFLEEKGEIDASYARKLREQLARHGLRSFGKKRTRDTIFGVSHA